MTKTIGLQEKRHRKTLREKVRKIEECQEEISLRVKENKGMHVELEKLNVAVCERRHVVEEEEERKRKREGFVTGAELRMKDIVQRRRLVELAKTQAREVALLRAEVERLRMRTFPALVQAQS